jgi:prefoldin alpha subunit
MSSDDEDLGQGLAQLRIYEGNARALQARLDVVNAAISEFSLASSTLEGVRTQNPDGDVLIPVGGGSFVRGRLADVAKIVVGVGAGVAIEKPIQDSITEIKSRVTELEKARSALQEQLTQTLIRIEEEREKLGEMVRKRGGDSLAVL